MNRLMEVFQDEQFTQTAITVALAVTFLSSTGWLAARCLPRWPAIRHLVLFSALISCFAAAVAAVMSAASGDSLLAIPVWNSASVVVAEYEDGNKIVEMESSNDSAAQHPALSESLLVDEEYHEVPNREIHSNFEGTPASGPVVAPNGISEPERPSPNEAGEMASSIGLERMAGWGILLWMAGTLVLGIRTAQNCWRAFLLRRRSQEVNNARLHRLLAEVVQQLGQHRRPLLLVSDLASTPLAMGFGKPAILLPAGLETAIGDDELRDVLLHEAAHLHRGDQHVALLQCIATSLFWPILSVHWLNRELQRAREDVCDNVVLRNREAIAYGETLLQVAEFLVPTQPVRVTVSMLSRPGELERRVGGFLQPGRSRAVKTNRKLAIGVFLLFIGVSIVATTTRLVAATDQVNAPTKRAGSPQETIEAVDPPTVDEPQPNVLNPSEIEWTEVPIVDRDSPTLHRGIVYGPDGQPLSGANVYAASTIELFELRDADEVTEQDLGAVRATTDELGRFEFHAPDLTWSPGPGRRERWEALLLVTKEGLAPSWVTTWGSDRNLRDHWHPLPTKKVEVHLAKPATLRGRLVGPDGQPLSGAKVELTSLKIPRWFDLDRHIEAEEVNPVGMFGTIDYQEYFNRPWLLPGIPTEVATDTDGWFTFEGLPADYIAAFTATHPVARTTSLRAAVREMEPVMRKPDSLSGGEPAITLRGSGFTLTLPKGVTLRGQVRERGFTTGDPIAGLTVAMANHNSPDGMSGQKFKTDDEGRFEITGLYEQSRGEGYMIAVVGSFEAPYASRRFTVWPEHEAQIEVKPAAAYRLTLTDADGKPVERDVESIQVQVVPDTRIEGVSSRFDKAVQVAPGVYQGMVPLGPGAVVVKRGNKRDRPILVDPKQFFEPGRTDWTLEEQRFAYGNQWHIARPAVIKTSGLSPGSNWTESQLDLAAVVFTNPPYNVEDRQPLELSAVIVQDEPVTATLVDHVGNPVEGARITRQLKRYSGRNMPATISLYGLHPERAEFIEFRHEELGLIGHAYATLSEEPLRVVMQPAATLTGRIVSQEGKPSFDFGVILDGAVPPDTMMSNSTRSGNGHGRFELTVPPGAEYTGDFVRKTPDWRTRPTVGQAFGPIKPGPGDIIDLGDLVVP